MTANDNVWDGVATTALIHGMRHFTKPRWIDRDGYMRQSAADEVKLMRAALKARDALPEEFATMPKHWSKGQRVEAGTP